MFATLWIRDQTKVTMFAFELYSDTCERLVSEPMLSTFHVYRWTPYEAADLVTTMAETRTGFHDVASRHVCYRLAERSSSEFLTLCWAVYLYCARARLIL